MKWKSLTLVLAITMLCSGVAVAADVPIASWAALKTATLNSSDIVKFENKTYTVDEEVALVAGVTYEGNAAGGTILDGQGLSRIFTATSVTGFVLDNLTLANGRVGTLGPPAVNEDGGAILIDDAAGTIQDCTFSGNVANALTVPPSTERLIDGDGRGGAIHIDIIAAGETLAINNCVFEDNLSADDGGAISLTNDTDITLPGGAVVMDACVFDNNAGDDSGAISLRNQGTAIATITNSVFVNNYSDDDGTIEVRCIATFTNCTFANNETLDRGVFAQNPEDAQLTNVLTIANCIFADNIVHEETITTRASGALTAPSYNLFHNNTVDQTATVAPHGDDVTIGSDGNIEGDPLLDAGYVPQDGSPAIDAADPATATATDITGAARDANPDIGAYESAPMVDTDGDGMPDDWESANGLDPNVDDASGDPDGDGFTNVEEYNSGMDPQTFNAGPVTEGTPVAGMLGLGAIAVACAFGGVLMISRKK